MVLDQGGDVMFSDALIIFGVNLIVSECFLVGIKFIQTLCGSNPDYPAIIFIDCLDPI